MRSLIIVAAAFLTTASLAQRDKDLDLDRRPLDDWEKREPPPKPITLEDPIVAYSIAGAWAIGGAIYLATFTIRKRRGDL